MLAWLRRTWDRARTDSPRLAARAGAHEAAAGTIGRAASGVYRHLERPTTIWEREWDVLCLLDGCRVDLMQEVAPEYAFLPAADGVDTIWSVGSQSAEWMAETFHPRFAEEMRRTAYVTGNPFSAQAGDQIEAVDTDPLPLSPADFGVLYESWRDEWIDDEISTIPPDVLTDAAIATWRRREELDVDRVIVHYMQPHAPYRSRPDWFIGSADIDDWGSLEDDEVPSIEDIPPDELDAETRELIEAMAADTEVDRDPWTRRRDGELPADEFWRAYRDNLAWVLDDVARLVENCDGTIVMSSDHGNGAGEFGVWSHPPDVHLPSLRRVPWVTVAGEDHHTTDPSLPESMLDGIRPDADARERLVDLGYR